MNEEAIKDAYGLFTNTGYNGSYEDFKQLIQSNPEARADAYGLFANTGYNGSQQDFDQLMGVGGPVPVKKKETSELPWNQKQEQPKPKPQPALPFLESKSSGISLGSQRVPEAPPMFEAPPMRTPEEAQAIVEAPEYKEEQFFTGTFGELLKNVDNPLSPTSWLGLGDFIDDFGRAVAQGSAQGDIVSPASAIFFKGSKVSDEEISKFRKASELAQKLGPSDEMVKFSEEYEKGGKTVSSFLKSLASNPGAIPEIMVSSYTSMVNAPSLTAAGTAIGVGAGYGAASGAAAGGVGAAPGAAAGAIASIPYAMAAMGATLETNLSLAESIQNKLQQDGLEWNDDNIRKVISDENFLKQARINAATRGVTIGAIDALTGRVAGKVGAKLLKAPKGGVVKAGLAAGGIEAVGGSIGEATARALTGQEMDIAEIGLEGIAELPGTVVSVGSEVLKKPLYKVNGEIRPESDVKEIVETADGDQLAKINIEITNDTKGYNEQIQEKVVSAQVKNEVKEVNPDLDEETTNEITRLEMELKKVEGKKTQSAKDKAASIRSQIKTLQENAVQKPSTEEGVLRPEESQVGLQEVGEGDAKEQAPAEEVVKEEVVTPEEDVAAALERIEIPEDTETLPGIDDELKTINESLGRVKEEVDSDKDERELQDLSEKVSRAKKKIATADDTDAAIEEFKQAEKEKSDFEEAISKKKNFNKVDALIADEIYQKNRGGYEYQELFDQDPRLAAIQSAKETIELGKGDFLDEEGVARYENDIKVLEEDIAKFPVKQAEPAPKVSSKTPKAKAPKAKSVPIPVAIPKPAPAPTPAPAPAPTSKTLKELEDEMSEVQKRFNAAKKKMAKYVTPPFSEDDKARVEYNNIVEEKNALEKQIEKVKQLTPAPAPTVVKAQPFKLSDSLKENVKGILKNAIDSFKKSPKIIKEEISNPYELKVYMQSDTQGFDSDMIFNFKGISNLENAINDIINKFPNLVGISLQVYDPNTEGVTKETPLYYNENSPLEIRNELKKLIEPTPKPAPAPAPTAVVSQPTTKAIGPEALRQEYIDKIAEVRLNKDKSRTPKQIDERVKELQDEYKKLKAEMTAPKPKAEAKPAPKKAAPAPKVEAKVEPVVSKKDQAEIKRLEDEIDYYQGQIDNAIEELGNTNYNYEEIETEVEKEKEKLEEKKMSKQKREDAEDELDARLEEAETDRDSYLEQYNNELKEAQREKKKAERKLAKLQAKQVETKAEPRSVVEEDEPSYDDIKDLDVSDPTLLERVEDFLDDMDDSLSEFGRGNLSSGMAIPLAKAIIKSLKVLVRAGITLQEAIKRVASDNNLEAKDVVNMIKDLDKAQSPMAKLKSQVQSEIQAAKEGARSVSDAIKAITDYFNFNAERGNLTRRDLRRVINAIAKIKDQKSLDKAADKIFAIIDKAKTDVIEVSSSKALVSQIKLEARAALGAKKDINQKRKDLSDAIKAMETTGKISAAKAKAILNKIGKVNLNNPASVDVFLDYVENVFEDAAYEVELAGINAKLAKARNNVNKKIGTAKTLTTVLNRLFSIKPSLIPVEILDDYKDIVDMFGDSAAVLKLEEITEVTQKVQDILDQIDDQLSLVPALATKLFNYDKAILNEDGALNYSATIEKMKEDKVIDDAEYELMRKYKSYIMPKTSTIPKTKAELAEEKKVLVKQVKEAASEATISPLASDDEKKMASSVIKLSKTNAVESLDNRQLENLLKIFENFKNGYFPAYANGINNDLIAAENAGFLSKAIAKAKMPTLAKLKLRITNKRKALFQRVKSTPLFNIDELFGDFKAKDIFNSLFNSLAQNQQRYALELEKINQKLEEALNKIAKSYGNNENKIVESKMKMAIYRIQREFQANPGNPSVNPAIEYINETIKAIKGGNTNYGDEDAKMLEKIAKDYSDGNGGIDAEKLKNSFNTAEQEAIDLFDKINKEVEDKAIFTGDVIRGDKVKLLNEYNHISVLPTKGQEADPIADVMSKFDPKNVVSTKAKSLIERTPEAKAINFDIFSTVQRGAKFVLMDYYLTNPVRVARKTINTTRKMMEENGTLTEDTNTIIDVINDALELALKSSLDQAAFNDSFVEQVIQEMAKTGYRAMLGGIPRAFTELTSNMAYVAMVNPKEWFTGLNMMKIIRGGKAVDIMESVGSKVISRVYGSDPLKGRMVDPSVLSKRTGIGASKLTGETVNVIATIHNNTTKKLKNTAELTADTLISSPDKIMMRPLWFGSFDMAFQDFAGKKPDYDKIEANDADYMIQNKEALEAAGRVADEKVTMAGNVDNPYMNALRAYIASDERGKAVTKFAKVFDNFMLKFQIGEYLTARRGIYAFFGNGNMSKGQAARLMAAVVTRMTVYTVMSKMASEFFYGLFLDDEEEDDDKSFAQKLGQGLASTFTSLFLGRDFGNAARSVINYGIEKANEKYLDFLRDGEYDPYEDAIQYTFIPPEKKGKSLEAFDVLANISGPYSPALKSLNLVTKKLTEKPKKEDAAIERQEAEKNIRVPLEILGNLGYVPLYKDIRAIVNKSIYSELDKELDEQGKKKEEFKPMGLNKSDLKRYYPEIYEQYYGEGTEDAARRKLEQEKNALERRMKDDYYNYVPKQRMKREFGGSSFGGGKKSKGFGSKGFGSGK